MLTEWIYKMDFEILDWIQENLRCLFLDRFCLFISFFGEKGWLFILMAVLFFCIPKYRKWGISLASGLTLCLLFGNILIKNMVERQRPYNQVEHYDLLVKELNDYSFPSAHTMVAFALFGVVFLMPVKKRYKVSAGILAFLMAFSRLYLYVHFPSDVLVGMILGVLFGVMGVRMVTMIMEEKNIDL